MNVNKQFLSYVIPSILAFALSGVYAIVDGYFIGNSIGDIGLSTINIAYPITASIQAIGTGIGMGGGVYFSINKAKKKEEEAKEFVAGTLWMLILSSFIVTIFLCLLKTPILKLLGAEGELLSLGEDYVFIIALGTCLQIFSTGLVPLIRNNGGSTFSMITMVIGFITNIILDYLFVWVYEWSTVGAALATIVGQGVAMIIGLIYLFYKGQINFKIPVSKISKVSKSIIKVGIAPFGLAVTPNFSLILINRFSVFYGGEKAIAVYACISYVICIVYLILQGIGDGSQPLMSKYYGEKDIEKIQYIRRLAYGFAILISAVSIVILFVLRGKVGVLFGASNEVIQGVADVFPIFLIGIPFIAITRITTAGFYATEKNIFSYILTYIEPVAMLAFMLILPPLFGGQKMIWWSTTFSRVFSAVLAVIFKIRVEKSEKILQYNCS